MLKHSNRATIWLAVGGVVVVGGVVASIVLGPGLRSPQQAAADAAAPPASLITVPAERRLLSESLVLRGQVKDGPSVPLRPSSAAFGETSVVTKVEAKIGQTVREGDVLIARSGEPMIALTLPFPLYRDLVGGLSGPDVTEVQQSLRRMGFRAPVHGTFDRATQQALADLHRRIGYPVPRGSAEAAKQLPAARQAMAEAEQAYRAGGSTDPALGSKVQQARAALEELELAAGPGLSRANVVLLDQPGRRVTAIRVGVGAVLKDPQQVIVDLDGQLPFVSAALSKDQIELVRPGVQGKVFDDVSGSEAETVVASVGAEMVNGDDGQPGYPVTLTFIGKDMVGAVGRGVRITITLAAAAEPALAVPVSAVYSRADGSTFVTVRLDSGATADRTVKTGRVAGGWVQITPDQADTVIPGTPVVVGAG
ncbi:hypothetical protein [Dactylosporangium sp. NPDC051484]|uniref:hypothetical protein n=1 Tax=Dactylosporangium sp. NPDC051484 TaxID=3154942 RepID=UPI00344F3CF2